MLAIITIHNQMRDKNKVGLGVLTSVTDKVAITQPAVSTLIGVSPSRVDEFQKSLKDGQIAPVFLRFNQAGP